MYLTAQRQEFDDPCTNTQFAGHLLWSQGAFLKFPRFSFWKASLSDNYKGTERKKSEAEFNLRGVKQDVGFIK